MTTRILFDEKNRCLVMLEGEIDHHNASQIRMKVDLAIDTHCPAELYLDFSGVSFMDSSGIGLVMGRYRILREYGAKLFVTNCKGSIRKVMQLSGMSRLAEFVDGNFEGQFERTNKEGVKNEEVQSVK
ncbi:MAG: anti-sigma factor antagonist [Oscillospiraceae bacterium]|nr:anti-sigma factor antagonist [Oscillospiraceae bacterium]